MLSSLHTYAIAYMFTYAHHTHRIIIINRFLKKKGWRYSTTVDYLANTCKTMIQIPNSKRKKKTDREPMELAQQVKILATKFGNLYP